MAQPADIASQRAQRDAALATAIAAADRVAALDAAIARAQRTGQNPGALQQQRAAADQAAQTARNDGLRFGSQALAGLTEWLAQTPDAIVATLSDDIPFVLLPVRIETKFARTADHTELRVRFFPDDVCVSAPPAALNDAEVALGQTYWRARAAHRGAPADTELRNAYVGAWSALAVRAGVWRAGLVVRATAPSNPDATSDLVFSVPALPDVPPLPRADVLPDRFVVIAYTLDAGTQTLRESARAVGAPIPDDLVLGPAAAQSDTWFSRDTATGRLIVPQALQWLVDFDAAERVGMALHMSVAAPFDTAGFDRVIALGVRSATPPEQGPAALQALLARHRDSDGCSILGAGTPTNRPTAAPGAEALPSDTDQLFAIEDAPPDIAPAAGVLGVTDGARLADLFGLTPEFARRLPNAATTDIAEAQAMNRALVPATVDDFVAEFLRTIVDPATAAALHRFFVTWISGRGLYPALRVGRQAYGIVLTSAWPSWKAIDAGSDAGIRDISPLVHSLVARHRPNWEALARQVSHVGQAASDPFALLLDVIGLEASSTAYVSRRAVSDEYLRQRALFAAAPAAGGAVDLDNLRNVRAAGLQVIDFPPVSSPTDPLLAFLLFLRDTQPWNAPLVDGDPAVPLSEKNRVTSYDGTHNYLWWLTQVSRADLSSQHFIGADGTTVPPPAALLYALLRHALLASVEATTLDTARAQGRTFFDVVDRDPLVANIGSAQNVLRRDYMEVDASRLGLAASPVALADWALAEGRRPDGGSTPAARIAEVNEAIAALADVPTARLERLLGEHADLCSHRLDAWVSALYAQRLAMLNARNATRALHLGAFGWLENVRPAARDALPPDALPAALRDDGPVFEDAANGGYVHAPSLMQAASAAVLRNGYLSHADSAQPTTFAVNLSSARMRAATALTEGVRSGQPIAALLGYQLERGLHEGHPGIELDSYIAVLRDRFPLLSGRLSEVPAGTSVEVTEARNVVDGLALVGATTSEDYPFGIAGLADKGTPAGNAIAVEVGRLHDALDAVSDLLLAESVHQAVQGNLTRTQAALQAMTSPATPPEPDIIRTPRSGRVLGFRVMLALDPAATGGWSDTLSPRARANPQLNHWLVQHLPAPAAIQWTVQDGTAPPSVQSLAGTGLEPLDVVLMSDDVGGAAMSALEQYLVRLYRAQHAVPDERVTVVAPGATADAAATLRIDFGGAATTGHALGVLKPLLSGLRALVTRSRAAHAGDWRRGADAAQADTADPTGSSSGHPSLEGFHDLATRLDRADADLAAATHDLGNALAAVSPLRAGLDADPGSAANAAWTNALDALRRALLALAAIGIAEALPAEGVTVTKTLVDRLIAQAGVASNIVAARRASAATLRSLTFADPLPTDESARSREIARRNHLLRQNHLEAGQALFGSAYVIVPLFRFTSDQSGEIAQARSAPPPADPLTREEWLHSAARVRPRVAELSWVLAGTRWCERAIVDPAVVQLPFTSGAPWIGSAFGAALPVGEWLSLLVFDAAATTGPLQTGLILDDWTETVPAARETTGVAFNFNRPNATAPQALLVAVPPELRGHWTFDDLVGSVHEALDLAKLRAIEPDALVGRGAGEGAPFGDYFQVLPAIVAQFTAGRVATTDFGAIGAASTAEARS